MGEVHPAWRAQVLGLWMRRMTTKSQTWLKTSMGYQRMRLPQRMLKFPKYQNLHLSNQLQHLRRARSEQVPILPFTTTSLKSPLFWTGNKVILNVLIVECPTQVSRLNGPFVGTPSLLASLCLPMI